jgi:hypothetical protein
MDNGDDEHIQIKLRHITTTMFGIPSLYFSLIVRLDVVDIYTTRKECFPNTFSGWFHLTHIILYYDNNTLYYFDMIDILFHLFPCSCVIPPNIHIDFHSLKLFCFKCSVHNIYLFRSWWQLCQTCAYQHDNGSQVAFILNAGKERKRLDDMKTNYFSRIQSS